jgi:hypothetical protein
MTTSEFYRRTFSICATAAILAGCSVLRQAQDYTQPPLGAPSVRLQTHAIGTRADRGESWVLPQARSDDLLYVSDIGTDDVLVFSYPQGALVGTLSGFDNPFGLCVDVKGDVFIANGSADTVVEYAHGGKTPIATLNLGTSTQACSVDEHTGDLAVVTPSYGIAIFKHAKGTPTKYSGQEGSNFTFCGYDGSSNLFIDGGIGSEPAFWELAKGSETLTNLTIQNDPFVDGYGPAQIQWDGRDVAIENPFHASIVRVRFSGPTGTVVGTTQLRRSAREMARLSWIQGNVVIVPWYYDEGRAIPRVVFTNYPRGGKGTEVITGYGLKYPQAATVSLARH